MLKLDRNAELPIPRLFREGMVLKEDMELLSSSWRMVKHSIHVKEERQGGGGGGGPAALLNRHMCTKQPDIISKKSWLCIGARTENSLDGESEHGPLALRSKFVSSIGESAHPLLLVDRPKGHLERGQPEEDLLVGLMSFHAPHAVCPSCSVYTSVAYFREWVLETMKGSFLPSRCVLLPKRVLETPSNYSHESPELTTPPQVDSLNTQCLCVLSRIWLFAYSLVF